MNTHSHIMRSLLTVLVFLSLAMPAAAQVPVTKHRDLEAVDVALQFWRDRGMEVCSRPPVGPYHRPRKSRAIPAGATYV